ncbi:MAG: hypothetical protein HYX84_00355 [Chloroflexi bacterium]|nr:hypothetical protein [Chloroflexota bacterium]
MIVSPSRRQRDDRKKGSVLNQNQIRRWVESQGESVLVVGDEETIKVHVHTPRQTRSHFSRRLYLSCFSISLIVEEISFSSSKISPMILR